ncbi:hypothetical protein C8J56DRAFT_899860 [Mycena floridula]|nr:hypothetical protein C8J56DRAFT_899860 [Mycena floridula]
MFTSSSMKGDWHSLKNRASRPQCTLKLRQLPFGVSCDYLRRQRWKEEPLAQGLVSLVLNEFQQTVSSAQQRVGVPGMPNQFCSFRRSSLSHPIFYNSHKGDGQLIVRRVFNNGKVVLFCYRTFCGSLHRLLCGLLICMALSRYGRHCSKPARSKDFNGGGERGRDTLPPSRSNSHAVAAIRSLLPPSHCLFYKTMRLYGVLTLFFIDLAFVHATLVPIEQAHTLEIRAKKKGERLTGYTTLEENTIDPREVVPKAVAISKSNLFVQANGA